MRSEHAVGQRDRVIRYTQLADSGEWSWPLFGAYVVREARRLGRDPAIEDAKTLLAGQYGISRADAFAMLRGVSSRRNEKLASVARRLRREGTTCSAESATAIGGD